MDRLWVGGEASGAKAAVRVMGRSGNKSVEVRGKPARSVAAPRPSMEIGGPRGQLQHPVCARLEAVAESWMNIATESWMDFKVILFGIVTCVYTLIIALPRIKRELSLVERITCSLIALTSLLVTGFNLVKDTYTYLAYGFVLAELVATAEVAWLWVTLLKLQRLERLRQSRSRCDVLGRSLEMIFDVSEAPEGGYDTFTQGEDWDDLKDMVRDAVRCHFTGGVPPA